MTVTQFNIMYVPRFGHKDQSEVIAPNKSSGSPTRLRPFDISMKEMILTRDSGMLLRPERSFAVIGGHGIE